MDDFSITTAIAILGLGLSIYSIVDMNRQRKRELKWRKADKAKEIVDEIFTFKPTYRALKLISRAPIEFKKRKITYKDLLKYIRYPTSGHSQREDYISVMIDELNYYFERMEKYIEVDYVNFSDIGPSFEWYMKKMKGHRKKFVRYAKDSGYKRSAAFLKRF